MNHLNSDLLRTFLAVVEAGSVTHGARRIHRSQSAASLQIKQLEGIIGRPLLRRHGRGVAPTDAGARLLPIARRVTRSLDAALADLRGERLHGMLRIGVPDDHGQTTLVRIIANFRSRHPDVELKVRCALGEAFEAALAAGTLDLAVFEVPQPAEGDDMLRQDTVIWMRHREADFDNNEVLPVAVFDRDCWWRNTALDGLEAADCRYQIVFSSESTIGVRSAVRAGIAAGFLSQLAADDELVPLSRMGGRTPSYLVLRRSSSASGEVVDAMREAIRQAFHAHDGSRSSQTVG